MKIKSEKYGIVHALVVVVFVIFICGCADQGVNQSQVRSASTTDTLGKIKSYKVRIHYLKLDNSFVEVQNDVVGTITIDLESNQVLWGDTPLKLVNPNIFFHEINKQAGLTELISLGEKSTDGENAVSIVCDGSVDFIDNNGQLARRVFIKLCQTSNGSFDDFFSYFKQLKFPQNYHGLVATAKYLDGTPTGSGHEFVASIQLVNQGCLLNEKTAHFYRSTLANGNGIIVVNNGESNLILGADGNWLFYDLNNSGTRFAGYDNSLMQVYSDLRQRTEESTSLVPTNASAAISTGFFITDDGYLISNFHVVKDATKIRLLTSAGMIDAKVIQTDAANDIALLKAEGKFSSLPILPSRSASLGDTVFTLGFPEPDVARVRAETGQRGNRVALRRGG